MIDRPQIRTLLDLLDEVLIYGFVLVVTGYGLASGCQ